jgi:magnesium transporter
MTRFDLQLADVKWIDLVNPSKESLEALAVELNMPLRPLMSCLDPEHLPKFENLEGEYTFVILRSFDTSCSLKANAVEDMTTKTAVFITEKIALTIHRLDSDFISAMRAKTDQKGTLRLKDLIKALASGTVMSFDEPLNQLEKDAANLEAVVFKAQRSSKVLRDGYLLKRKTSSLFRVLQLTSDVISRLSNKTDYNWEDSLDLKERNARLIFYTDELSQKITSFINLYISLVSQKTNEASYKTNEIMRVLTVFSIFFLPLNFIAGIYGMNFKHMPELATEYGYFYVLGTMVAVAAGIYLYAKKQGWLSSPED